MSGLTSRPEKQQRKAAHAQEPVVDPAQQAMAPQLPQRPPASKPAPQPEVETPQDKLGSVLMALAGKSPAAMPAALGWTKAGGVTVLPPSPQTGAQAPVWSQSQGRAADVLEALTGRAGRTLSTHDADATWAVLTQALAAGQTVVAGGGDDQPRERHGRARTALVVAADVLNGERRVTLAPQDAAEETLDFTELCREFPQIAVSSED